MLSVFIWVRIHGRKGVLRKNVQWRTCKQKHRPCNILGLHLRPSRGVYFLLITDTVRTIQLSSEGAKPRHRIHGIRSQHKILNLPSVCVSSIGTSEHYPQCQDKEHGLTYNKLKHFLIFICLKNFPFVLLQSQTWSVTKNNVKVGGYEEV
jgi:hypothetical protein